MESDLMAKVQPVDFYEVLGVAKNAKPKEIQAAYEKKMRQLDRPAQTKKGAPSLTALTEQADRVKEAFDVLSDPAKRIAYNRWMKVDGTPKPSVTIPLTPPSVMAEIANERPVRNPQSVYLDYFGFKEKPFDLTPDPKYLYLSAKHKEVLAHLVFGLQENNGFLKIVGEVGTGKTTIIRSFLKELTQGFSFAYIFHPCVTALELLQSINSELGLECETVSKKDLINHLHRFLLKERSHGNRVVVIIDEAQNLDPGVLEELRLLSNLETETEKLIQIVLIGQPELDTLLERNELRQLRQRITIQWNLLPLNVEETRGYIQHRINVAGGKGRLRFERAAVDTLYNYTQGIPRMINVMADRALLIAYTTSTKRITPKVIRMAAKDIGGVRTVSQARQVIFKGILPGLVLAAMLYFGLDTLAPFHLPEPPGAKKDISKMIEEDPLDLSTPGKLVPQNNPVTAPSIENGASPEIPQPEMVSPAVPRVTVPQPVNGVISLTTKEQLTAYLSTLSLEDTKVEAAKWVLQRWNVLPDNLRGMTVSSLDSLPEDYDLSLYELNGNLDRLKLLNQPAILEILLPGELGTKYLALNSINGNRGQFGSMDIIEMPLELVDSLWTRKAFIVWRDFEKLPEHMKNGFRGREAIWLQKNLRLLGFFHGREAMTYGPKTSRAVSRFQRRYQIRDDGRFDTESRIQLYNLLSIYPTPQLVVP